MGLSQTMGLSDEVPRELLVHVNLAIIILVEPPLFDEVIASPKTAKCLKNEYIGNGGYRGNNPLHKPYINICKILTSYKTVNPDKITLLWNDIENFKEPLTQIVFFDFGELHFEVYE